MDKKTKQTNVNSTIVESLVFFLISIFGIIFSIKSHKQVNVEWQLSPYLFPLFVSILLLVLSITLFLDGCKEGPSKKKTDVDVKSIVIFVAMCIAYYIVIPYIGFILTSIVFLIGMFLLLGEKKWWLILLLSVAATMAIWGLFGKFLHVMLPSGYIWFYVEFYIGYFLGI